MSRTKQEVSLLEYVIAYLQEEQERRSWTQWSGALNHKEVVEALVKDAIDAYAGGAR